MELKNEVKKERKAVKGWRIFMTFIQNSSIAKNDIQGLRGYPHHQSSFSLLSGGTVQPETTYSFILKVMGEVWESQKG